MKTYINNNKVMAAKSLLFFMVLCGTLLLTVKAEAQEKSLIESNRPVLLQENQVANSIDNPLVAKAVAQLEQANRWQQAANKLILSANNYRKQLKKVRARVAKNARNKPVNNEKTLNDQAEIKQLLSQLMQAQQQGTELREKSQQLKQQARVDFEQAMVQIWPQWLQNRDVLTLEQALNSTLAHNSQVRSVHKNMLELSNRRENTGLRGDMSLQVQALSKQNAPAKLNTASFQFSRHEQYFAHIEVHPTGSEKPGDEGGKAQLHQSRPPAVPLNEIHQWRLMISDVQGNPVKDAEIEVQGHMPGHVHGLPTKPAVVEEIDPGVYLVDGLKFQMKGWWVMKFIVHNPDENSSENADDFFTFNLVL